MNSLLFIADVTSSEHLIVQETATRLRDLLSEADAAAWTSDVRSISKVEDISAQAAGAVYILSLSDWLADPSAPWDEVAPAVRERVKLVSAKGPNVVLLTTFRHVTPGSDHDFDRDLLVRIRRLNLLAAKLSNEFGVSVADLDRDCADVGAQRLATDFRLGGKVAIGLAAWSLARCVAANALDGLVDFNLQDRIVAANDAARPRFDGVAHVQVTGVTRFSHGRRTQKVAFTPGPVVRGIQLFAGVSKGQVRWGEIQIRLARAVRDRKLLHYFRLLARELANTTFARRR